MVTNPTPRRLEGQVVRSPVPPPSSWQPPLSASRDPGSERTDTDRIDRLALAFGWLTSSALSSQTEELEYSTHWVAQSPGRNNVRSRQSSGRRIARPNHAAGLSDSDVRRHGEIPRGRSCQVREQGERQIGRVSGSATGLQAWHPLPHPGRCGLLQWRLGRDPPCSAGIGRPWGAGIPREGHPLGTGKILCNQPQLI